MTFIVTMLPFAIKAQIQAYETEILAALNTARNQTAGGHAAVQLDRWFGNHTHATQLAVRDGLSKIRSYTKNQNITCQIGVARPANENALAQHFKGIGGIKSGHTHNSLAVIDAGAAQMGGSLGILNISPNFANLPPYIVDGFAVCMGQSQFETVVHELSHIVIGTRDEVDALNVTAYGGANARALAAQSPALALTNAENWGFFVEEFR